MSRRLSVAATDRLSTLDMLPAEASGPLPRSSRELAGLGCKRTFVDDSLSSHGDFVRAPACHTRGGRRSWAGCSVFESVRLLALEVYHPGHGVNIGEVAGNSRCTRPGRSNMKPETRKTRRISDRDKGAYPPIVAVIEDNRSAMRHVRSGIKGGVGVLVQDLGQRLHQVFDDAQRVPSWNHIVWIGPPRPAAVALVQRHASAE